MSSIDHSTMTSVNFFIDIFFVLISEIMIFCLKKDLYLHRSRHSSIFVPKLRLSEKIAESSIEKRLSHNVYPLFLGFLHFTWKHRLDVDWKKVYAIAQMTFRWCTNRMLPKQGHWKVVPSVLLTKLFACHSELSLRLRCFARTVNLCHIIIYDICCWNIKPI